MTEMAIPEIDQGTDCCPLNGAARQLPCFVCVLCFHRVLLGLSRRLYSSITLLDLGQQPDMTVLVQSGYSFTQELVPIPK